MLDEKKHRALAVCLFAAVLVACAAITAYRTGDGTEELDLGEGVWVCTVEDEKIATAEITDGSHVTIRAGRNGNTHISFEREDGTRRDGNVTASNGVLWVSLFDTDE